MQYQECDLSVHGLDCFCPYYKYQILLLNQLANCCHCLKDQILLPGNTWLWVYMCVCVYVYYIGGRAGVQYLSPDPVWTIIKYIIVELICSVPSYTVHDGGNLSTPKTITWNANVQGMSLYTPSKKFHGMPMYKEWIYSPYNNSISFSGVLSLSLSSRRKNL